MRRLKKTTMAFLFFLGFLLSILFVNGFYREQVRGAYTCADECYNGINIIYGVYSKSGGTCYGPFDSAFSCSGTAAACEGSAIDGLYLDSSCTEPGTKGCCTTGDSDCGACNCAVCPEGQTHIPTGGPVVSTVGCWDLCSQCDTRNCYAECSCGSWTNGSCGGGSCVYNQRLQTRTCTPSGCATQSRCVADASCEDNTPPTTSANPTSRSWSYNNVSVTITASDTGGSGVNRIEYCWTTGDTCTNYTTVYSSSTTVTRTTNGSWNLCHRARDNAGNIGTRVCNGRYLVEKTPPSVSASNSTSSWFDNQRTAIVSASDTGGSGLAQVRYSWGSNAMNSACNSGGTVTSNGATLNAPEGGTTLYLCARDVAGNVGTWSGTYRWCTPTTPSDPSEIYLRYLQGGSTVLLESLSTSSSNPTVVRRLRNEQTGQTYIPQFSSVPSCASEYGYGYLGSGGLAEYIHSDYVHDFNPQSALTTEGFEGSVTGKYYTISMAGTKIYSPDPRTGYYRINNNPIIDAEFNCPVITNNEQEKTSARQCTSTTHTGIEVNNPLKFEIKGSDLDGNDEIQGAILWLSKEGTWDEIPEEGIIAPLGEIYTGSNLDHLGVMILKNGDSWDSPLVYTLDPTLERWQESTEIRNTDGTKVANIIVPNPANGTEVTFGVELDFEEVDLSGWIGDYVEGNYELSAMVFDEYMLLTPTIIDQYYVIKDCRVGGWNFDLRSPLFTQEPAQSIIAAGQIRFDWELEDTTSGIKNVVINAYGHNTEEEVSLLIPDDGQENIALTGGGPPEEDEIGIMTGDNRWLLTYDPPRLSDSSYILSGTGGNEEGNIDYYFTGFDQACNDVLASEGVNLNPWITAKGGLVHSAGSVGVNSKDVSEYGSYLNDILTRVQVNELDTGTELISSRSDGIINIIHPELGAVSAHSTFNSNSKDTFWFNYLKSKLDYQQTILELTEMESLSGDSFVGLCRYDEDRTCVFYPVSEACDGENCFVYTDVDISVPKNYICDKNTLIMTEGSINIEPDIYNGSEDDISGCIFVARNNITVGAGDWKTGWVSTLDEMKYDYVDAFMLAENKVSVPLVDVLTGSGSVIEHRDGLEVYGGIVAFGRELGSGESAVDVKRSLRLYNNYMPTVATTWDPRYAKLSEIFFGTSAVMYKQEVGFKPY